MKILMINKFLHPKGGSETYVFQLGACLESRGHQVQYFGMEHPNRQLGNHAGAYAPYIDYHGGSRIRELSCLYSREAAKELRRILEDFAPDVCHVNNFHHQLTPSILLEIARWRKERGVPCAIVYTAHDSQLVCPNHLLRNGRGENCRECLGGHYYHCIAHRCIHGSLVKSIVGATEAWIWDRAGVYRNLDRILAPSEFLARQLETHPDLRGRITIMPNFVNQPGKTKETIGNYVLYFGRYSREKGIATLLQAVDALPQISFIFAGDGPMKAEIGERPNLEDRGFLSGSALASLIIGARFVVVPSECYENCPFSILESLNCGTPVLAANIGGIPELVRDREIGELFESGNANQLAEKIEALWNDESKLTSYSRACQAVPQMTAQGYCEKLEGIYQVKKL